MVVYRVPFSKSVEGFALVEIPEGKDVKEFMENDWDGDVIDEFDHNSEYEYDYEEAEIEEDVEQTRKERRDENGG